jgi:acyl CoA:acetate/3-ketoacid CoA transferase alpha subunit
MTDKRLTEDEVVAQLRSGTTIAIGGWGSRRKPMSIVRAILRSDLTDLTIVSHGGPDLGLLCAAGKVRRAIYAFVSLDQQDPGRPPAALLEPHFRKARQSGAIEDEPLDEGMVHLGLQAAAWRVPFLPTRVGLGSDLWRDNSRLASVRSPFADGEELVAVPAFELDAAICHLNRADERGNAVYLGPDLYWDDLMLQAAPTGRRFISTEKVVPTRELGREASLQQMRISRMMVDGVVEAPGGAHFTSCEPDYGRDETFQKDYMATAKSPEAWDEFRAAWLDLGEREYQAKVEARR